MSQFTRQVFLHLNVNLYLTSVSNGFSSLRICHIKKDSYALQPVALPAGKQHCALTERPIWMVIRPLAPRLLLIVLGKITACQVHTVIIFVCGKIY